MTKGRANAVIAFITLLYGVSFVFIKMTINAGFSPAFIVFARGAMFFALTLIFFGKSLTTLNLREFLIGCAAGVLSFGGYYFQTLGSKYTTPASNAFLTAMNALVVPVASLLLYREKPSKRAYLALPAGIIGMVLLTGFRLGTPLNRGDVYTLICALLFGLHISFLGHTAAGVDYRKTAFLMAVWQMVGGGALFAAEDMSFFGTVDWSRGILSLVFLGVFCSFLASTAQIYAQKFTSPTTAGLIMVMEGVFAAALSVLLGLEPFALSLLTGGTLIMLAVAIMEADFSWLFRRFSRRGGGGGDSAGE